MATAADENYIRARTGLLDALAALGPIRKAAVLVGAQAVYEHTHEHDADYAVSPFTLDADLALVPEQLVEDPRIIDAMEEAGYTLAEQPGIYRRESGVQVELLVLQAVGGRSGRGAELGSHGIRAARQVRGLEGVLVSRRPMRIGSLTLSDDRNFEINVAGPAALLVAKLHKLGDRIYANDDRRLSNKDAFDIFRLLQAIDVAELIDEVNILAGAPVSKEATNEAMVRFRELFESPMTAGTELVADMWLALRIEMS